MYSPARILHDWHLFLVDFKQGVFDGVVLEILRLKKWSFSTRIFSVNVTKFAHVFVGIREKEMLVSANLLTFTQETLNGKLHFFVQCLLRITNFSDLRQVWTVNLLQCSDMTYCSCGYWNFLVHSKSRDWALILAVPIPGEERKLT